MPSPSATKHLIQTSGIATTQSPSMLWHNAPVLRSIQDPTYAYMFWDDFTDLPTGKYTATQATAGTFALGDGAGGVALADCNSTTATQGINVQLGGTTGEFIKPAADKDIWFEARVKAADTATGPEFFLGLAAIDTTIIATSANSSANHIGWQSVTDDNVLLFSAENAGTGSTDAATTLVDDTWVRLGFKVNGVSTIDQYIDGVKQSETHVTANIPVTEMTLSLVCQSGGTTDPIVHIDWWRVLQIR